MKIKSFDDLKAFCNSLTPEQLKEPVVIGVEDHAFVYAIELSVLQEVRRSHYNVSRPAGTPMIEATDSSDGIISSEIQD